MVITRQHIPRRTVLRGMGVTMALPFMEAMVPARSAWGGPAGIGNTRLIALEMVHGAAGSTAYGLQKNLWSPAAAGPEFDLSPTSLSSLEPFRDELTIVSNCDIRNAEAFTPPEIGGDHFRSSATFLTQSHCKQTQGSDVQAGPSLDQLYAQRAGRETPISSMQLCIENVDQSGGCSYGYSCVYTDSISWASATEPLPMIRDPRAVFDQLFGVGATPAERVERRNENASILDWIFGSAARLKSKLGASDQIRLDSYLDEVREIEQRIQKVEARNSNGDPRELPGAPMGVPDSFEEHIKLMFDLQVLALAADTTRVFAFKLGRDVSNRVFPESGFKGPFHPSSHHQEKDDRIENFAKINRYHVSLVPYLLEKLKNTPDGERTLLENTLVLYGSAMGNPNLHNHKRVPFFLAGHAGGRIKGGLHIKAPDGTPLANAMLSVLHALGVDDLQAFGDSTSPMDLNGVAAPTVS